MLFGLGLRASSQQAPLPSAVPVAESGLPGEPEDQASTGPVGSGTQPVAGQLSLGSIHGAVVDRDGDVYEGARVALAQTVAGSGSSAGGSAGVGAASARTVTSDANGRFSFSDVPAGPYKLTVSSNGFATQVVSGILQPGENYEAKAIVLLMNMATSDVQVTATQQEIAQEVMKEEETQRVLGVVPNFYVTYVPNAPPLSSKQKFELAWKSSIDPVTFLAVGVFAGVEQASNSFSGYGQGAQGYAKRFGAGYGDSFIGTMIGSAILPVWWKQDPRYFYKGTGTVRSRALYAIANSVICKGDNGRWQANYSGLIGGLAAGGISNLYYPASDRDGVALTFEDTLIGTAESAVENLFQEFVVRRLTPRIPNYGAGKP